MNIAQKILEAKEDLEQEQLVLERMKGKREAILKQFKELNLTPKQAEEKVGDLQKEMENLDVEIQKKWKAFNKAYPQLGE